MALVMALASTGCATRQGAAVALVSGAVTVALGAAVMADSEPCPPMEWGCIDGDGVGVILLFAGASMIIPGLVGIGAPRDEAPPPALALQDTTLPVLVSDPTTLRYAHQARRAAADGRCTTVEAMLRQIKSRDPAYHAVLASSPALGGCR
jgi:hypothetical protein